MASLSLINVYKTYFGERPAVSNFNLEMADKEFVVLLGPPSCGKSTVLRLIAGMDQVSQGEVYIGGKLMNDISTRERNVSIIFQDYTLYPNMNVFDNLAFHLKAIRTPQDVIEDKVQSIASIVGVKNLLEKMPKELSRVENLLIAVGRAIIKEPGLYLFDEPFINLDKQQQVQMQKELVRIHSEVGGTFVFVTDDAEEAMALGKRTILMRDGIIEQTGSAQSLYSQPKNLFTAGYISTPAMNFIDAELIKKDGMIGLQFGKEKKYFVALPKNDVMDLDLDKYEGKDVIMGIRPENLHETEFHVSTTANSAVEAEVESSQIWNSHTYLLLKYEDIPLIAKATNVLEPKPGQKVQVAIEIRALHAFDKETGANILHHN